MNTNVSTEIKIGDRVMGKRVAEYGKNCDFGIGNQLVPVRFEDGTYAIAFIQEYNGSTSITTWAPNNDDSQQAIEKSKEMPVVNQGFGSGVIHVHGADEVGKFLVKLYYNDKSGREEVLHR